MRISALIVVCAALGMAGCAPPAPQVGPNGLPYPKVYRLQNKDLGRLQIRMLDGVNTLRTARGLEAFTLNAELNAAAATHSRDMSVQNRPWHFGSDGSSPMERVTRVGYAGILQGELLSETFETEMETLAAWVNRGDTRTILFDPDARDMGFAFYQDRTGKLWWTLVTGKPNPPLGPSQDTPS